MDTLRPTDMQQTDLSSANNPHNIQVFLTNSARVVTYVALVPDQHINYLLRCSTCQSRNSKSHYHLSPPIVSQEIWRQYLQNKITSHVTNHQLFQQLITLPYVCHLMSNMELQKNMYGTSRNLTYILHNFYITCTYKFIIH